MAAKSSSSARGDTGAPKRRRTTKKVAEPAPVETGEEHEETESVRSREEERPASTRGSAGRHDADDSGFAAGLDIPESALDFEPADDSRMDFSPREESRDESDEGEGEGEVEQSRDEFDNRGGGGGTPEEHDHKRRRRRRRRRRGGQGEGQGQGQAPQPQQSQQRQQQRGPRGRHQGHQGHQGHSQGQNGRERERDTPSIGTVEGILELHPKGYGFLRDPKNNYASVKNDTFVSSTLIEKNRLREGVLLKGEASAGIKGQGPRLKSIETIDGRTPEEYMQIRPFDELTPINPFEQIKLETGAAPVTMRVMDLLTPIGKGQRALIVAPPRTGKTMLLQEIANAVSTNHPEVHLMVLLIDERPEEVTEMRRRIRGEVVASSMDRDVDSHVRIAQLIVERAKRIAEAGGEVFVLLDSITRTARAFNKWVGSSGRTGSGGLDIKALDIPKKLFGTARRFDEGGSLTVVATALIETGSRMDDVIFQEFKGTGNMEMVLNRQLADRRIWPSIDIQQSGTRREEKILSPEVLEGVTTLRRSLVSMNSVEAMEQLIRTLQRFPSNADFLARIRSVL